MPDGCGNADEQHQQPGIGRPPDGQHGEQRSDDRVRRQQQPQPPASVAEGEGQQAGDEAGGEAEGFGDGCFPLFLRNNFIQFCKKHNNNTRLISIYKIRYYFLFSNNSLLHYQQHLQRPAHQ